MQIPAEFPAYKQLAQAQNARLDAMQTVYADGVIEIRWHDKKGNHFEQGNMELWLQLPRRTALRVEKLGEVLLWLGSDEQRYWLFDLLGDQTTLYLGGHNDAKAEEESGALNVRPLALLDLMGLGRLPPDLPAPPTIEFDSKLDAWVVPVDGAGGPMRMFMDRQSLLPVRVETLTTQGQVALLSTLKRWESVTLKGVSPAQYPKMAELIDIVSGPAEPDAGQVKIAINEAVGYADAEQLHRVFDINRLIQALHPSRIEGPHPDAPGP